MRHRDNREEQIKRRIFAKFAKRMEELRQDPQPICHELSPDVIVISGDQTVLFEPQNTRVAEWLRLRFGLDNLSVRDRVRVHPDRNDAMMQQLKAAGFEVR